MKLLDTIQNNLRLYQGMTQAKVSYDFEDSKRRRSPASIGTNQSDGCQQNNTYVTRKCGCLSNKRSKVFT